MLRLIVKGVSLTDIGDELCLSVKTVGTTPATALLAKLGLHSNADLVRYCLEHGWRSRVGFIGIQKYLTAPMEISRQESFGRRHTLLVSKRQSRRHACRSNPPGDALGLRLSAAHQAAAFRATAGGREIVYRDRQRHYRQFSSACRGWPMRWPGSASGRAARWR